MHELCKKGKVSYGYPMGMVWVSYGKTSTIPVQYQYNTSTKPRSLTQKRLPKQTLLLLLLSR